MFATIYLATFVASLTLLFRDQDFATIKQPCTVCMSRLLIALALLFLFAGAEIFTFFTVHSAWVISGVMTLSICGFLFGIYFIQECKKWNLALLQMLYVVVITTHFYSWWYP